jgi:type II secretory pathway pseudopilin PulG
LRRFLSFFFISVLFSSLFRTFGREFIFNMMTIQLHRRGISLLEVIIGVGIMSLITTLGFTSLQDYRARQNLNSSVGLISAVFNRTRLDTIAAKRDHTYSVTLASNTLTYQPVLALNETAWTGAVETYRLPRGIEIANIALTGGVTAVAFQRLSGATLTSGTFDVRVTSSPNLSKTFLVSLNGTVTPQ